MPPIAPSGPADARAFCSSRRGVGERPTWRRERGTTVVFITHRLAEIRDFCDGLTVLRNGALVGICGIDDVPEDEVVRLMIGCDLKAAFPDHASARIGCRP